MWAPVCRELSLSGPPRRGKDSAIYFCFHFPGSFSGPFTSLFSHQPFDHSYVVMLCSRCRKGDRIRINSQYTSPLRLSEKQAFDMGRG